MEILQIAQKQRMGVIPHHPVQIVRVQAYPIVAGKVGLSGRKPAINRKVTRATTSSS
jgi:hypothetical protein